jgi:hypothetical protein
MKYPEGFLVVCVPVGVVAVLLVVTVLVVVSDRRTCSSIH